MLEIGIALPQQDLLEAAQQADALGLRSLTVADVLIGTGTPALEPIVALSMAAAVTERVQLDFGLLSLPTRPVAMLAAQIQTLQYLSGNRVRLGVGIGGFPGAPFWQAVDAPESNRGRLLDDALKVLPSLISGEPTQLPQAKITLTPGTPVPPIGIGGNSEAAIRRTAKYGDYWLPSARTTAELAAASARLRELADEYGRPMPRIHHALHAVINEDGTEMTKNLAEFFQKTPAEIAEMTITGSPRQAADRLATYAEAGADEQVIVLDGTDHRAQLELLAEAISLL